MAATCLARLSNAGGPVRLALPTQTTFVALCAPVRPPLLQDSGGAADGLLALVRMPRANLMQARTLRTLHREAECPGGPFPPPQDQLVAGRLAWGWRASALGRAATTTLLARPEEVRCNSQAANSSSRNRAFVGLSEGAEMERTARGVFVQSKAGAAAAGAAKFAASGHRETIRFGPSNSRSPRAHFGARSLAASLRSGQPKPSTVRRPLGGSRMAAAAQTTNSAALGPHKAHTGRCFALTLAISTARANTPPSERAAAAAPALVR